MTLSVVPGATATNETTFDFVRLGLCTCTATFPASATSAEFTGAEHEFALSQVVTRGVPPIKSTEPGPGAGRGEAAAIDAKRKSLRSAGINTGRMQRENIRAGGNAHAGRTRLRNIVLAHGDDLQSVRSRRDRWSL